MSEGTMETERWTFGPFRLEPQNARLYHNLEAVKIPPKHFAVLIYLIKHHGQLVTKDQLLDAIWRRKHVTEGVLKTSIAALRKALGDRTQRSLYIETVPRRGYRFIGEVVTENQVTHAMHHQPRLAIDTGPLVGREEQLNELERLWQGVSHGRRAVVFVTGEAGIGKSSLVDMFVQRLEEEVPSDGFLRGHCIAQRMTGEPYLPILDAFSRFKNPARLKAVLSRHAPGWLWQLPSLLEISERSESLREAAVVFQTRMLREGCGALEALAAEAPLVLMLENLHWSDHATLELLDALARRRNCAKLFIIATYRPSYAMQEYSIEWLQCELQAHCLCTGVAVEPFSLADIRLYLERRFPKHLFPAVTTEILYRRAGGHPLFTTRLVEYFIGQGLLRDVEGTVTKADAALEDKFPDDIRLVIEQLLASLSPNDQILLEAASAIGIEFSAAALALLLQEEVVMIEANCDALARKGSILKSCNPVEWPDGRIVGRYAFRYSFYRDVLYQQLTPTRRADLHRSLSEQLEASYGNRTEEIAVELARHFKEGGNITKAVYYLRLAATRAAGQFLNNNALGYLSQALALIDHNPESRVDEGMALLRQRALIHRSLAQWNGVVTDLEAVAALARKNKKTRNETEALLLLISAQILSDRSQLIGTIEGAVSKSTKLCDDQFKAYAMSYRSYYRLQFGLWEETDLEIVTHGIAIARRAKDHNILSNLLVVQALLFRIQSRYNHALATGQEAARLALDNGDGFNHLLGHYFAGWAALGLGKWEKLKWIIDAGLQAADQNSSPLASSLFHLLSAAWHVEALDFRGALELCQSGTPRAVDSYARVLWLVLRGHAFLGLGDSSAAARSFEELSQVNENDMLLERHFRLMLYHGLGTYWLKEGEPERSTAEAQRILALCPAGERNYTARAHCLLARSSLLAGKGDDAVESWRKALATIEDLEVPLAASQVYALGGELYQQSSRKSEAQEFYIRAAAITGKLTGSLN